MGLDFYRSKTGNIRGKTLKDKIQFLMDRYDKVVRDCAQAQEDGRDKSTFRVEFGQAHDYFCGKLTLIEPNESNLREILQEFVHSYKNCANTGWKEAYGYAIAEIESALEAS